jgi:ABC-type phosphate transport system substrate-binding protein
MNRHHKARRLVAAAAVCLGTTAAAGLVGSAPALASVTCDTNWASGSSLQANAQKEVWFNATTGFPAHLGNCIAAPTQTYDKTSSEFGLGEFGNVTGKLEPIDDQTGSPSGGTAPVGVLDGWVGSDDAPTAGQIGNASRSAPAASPIELTIPVAQAPVAVILSLPATCELLPTTVGKPIRVEIENVVLDELWQGNKFASWEAFLKAVTLTNSKVPATGCTGAITREVRSVGSGTSYAFKNYLAQIDPSEWSQYATDYVNWPGTYETSFGGHENKSGGNLAEHVAENPGSIGYANTADAATLYGCLSSAGCTAGKVAFNGEATSTEDGGSAKHQILWAKIQNNGISTTGAGYAGPQTSPTGATKASEFVGNCATSKITPSEYGAPHSPEDSWNGVLASDPDATADLSGNFYPICALTYDLAWKHYEETNLKTFYNNTTEGTTDEGILNTVKNYLTYVTSSAAGEGQAAIQSFFYQELPSALQVKAAAAAAAINK